MRLSLLATLSLICIVNIVFAADNVIEKRFATLDELGKLEKPYNSIDNAEEAYDFIMADKIVREHITRAKAEGYTSFKVKAEVLKGDEPLYLVTVSSTALITPYYCVYRFDHLGNDKTDIPGNGCQYE